MEHFSDEYSNLLLGQSWLVKIDATNSIPYLIVRVLNSGSELSKFCTSSFNASCCILITDTKRVWAEVLTRKEFARRWRDCNNQTAPYTPDSDQEESWRTSILQLLSKAHTLGSFVDISFEVVESNYSTSVEVLSKHLIVPLVSANHLAFTSADPVSELSEADLEKAVDKMGRTAKRSADIHFRNAMSKPRVATTICRVTSVLNSISDIPAINFTAEKSELLVPISQRTPEPWKASRSVSPAPSPLKAVQSITRSPSPLIDPPAPKVTADSATESDEDAKSTCESPIQHQKSATPPHSSSAGPSAKSFEPHGFVLSRKSSPSSVGPKQSKGTSDSDSSPMQPAKKKLKPISSSDDDSKGESRKQARGGVPKRGTRQPIKRGGKRF